MPGGTAPGRAGEAGTPFQLTPGSTEGEAGRALPAPGTAPCPREGGNHQWDLLSRAKPEAVPIQAQGSEQEGRLFTARHPWQGAQHGQATQDTPLLLPPPPPLWPLRSHKLHQASANHLPQSLFPPSFLRSRPAGHPGRCLPAPYQAGISRDGISRDGISRPSPPGSAPGWGAAPPAAPAMPALPPPLEASQADSLQLERSCPQNPWKAVLDQSDSTWPQPEQGKNRRVVESQHC